MSSRSTSKSASRSLPSRPSNTSSTKLIRDARSNARDQFTPYDSVHSNPWNFFTSTGEFNLALFNRTFVEDQMKQHKYYQQIENQQLAELNAPAPKPSLLSLSVGEQLLNVKNAFFNIISDVQRKPLSIETFTSDNRMYYIGLLFVIIFIVYVILKQI
jgi:hypothetical protein